MGIIDRAMIRRARVDITSSLKGVTRTCFRFIAALALCLGAAGAHALSITFDHYFEGLTPNSDGVYVIEPGTTLEYRVAINLEDTRASSSDSQATYTTWWRQATLSLKFNEGGASTGDFAAALPGNASSEVIHRRLLTLPAAGGEDFFRTFRWTYRDIFGTRSYTLQMAAAGRASDAEKASAGMLLRVSKTAAATLVRPTDAARMERVASDQLVLSGATIPTVNSTRTNGVELEMPLSITSPHWSGDGAQEFNPPTIVINPNPLRIRFAERENDVDVAVVGENFQTLALSRISADLNAGSTMAAPSAIMHFQITDGADGFPAIVEGFNISVVEPSVSEISDAQLEAFTYYLQRADDPSQTWPLTMDTANNRLTAETITEAAPLVVGGSTQSVTVNFVVYAYQHDTSVRIIDEATFRLIFQNLLSTHFVLSENGSGLRHGNEDLAMGGVNTGGYNVRMNVVGTQWHQTGVARAFPGDGDGVVYLVDSAEYPNMVLSGEWRDAHDNVDGNYQATDLIATFTNMTDNSVVGEATLTLTYSEFPGGDKVVLIGAKALRGVTATHALNLTNSFAGALRILEAKTDSGTHADGSQWTVTVRDGADGAQSAPFAFTVQIQAHSATLEPNSLRLDKPFSHGVASRLTYQLNFIAIDGLEDRQTPGGQGIVAGCNACPGFSLGEGSIDHSGMTLIPLLNSGDFHASAADRTLAFSIFAPGSGLPAITAPTVADLATDSPVQDFVILPPPVSTLTVSVSDGSGSNLNTDGSYTRMVDITIVRTDPDRSDDRYTKATFSVSQLDVVLGQDRSSVRLQDVEVSLHTASSAPAARTSGNGATESVSLRPSAYNISPGSTNTGPTLRLRYIDPTGVDESIGTISVNSMAFTLTQDPPAAANVVIVDQVGLTQGDGVDNIRALNIAVDATKVVGAELETSAGCRHDPDDKTFASGDTLTCIERARLRVKTQVQYQDANNNVDTAARSHSWHLVDLTADPNTEQELVAATAGDVGRVPMRGAFDGKADKSRFRLEARSAGLTPFTLPFTLDFENSGATFASANLAFGGDLRHQASALVTVPGIALVNTYTNTHNTDANRVIVVVRAECATTAGGMTAEGCDGAASMFSGPSGIANDVGGAFKATFGMQAPTDGSMLNIGNLSITPSVDLSALQSISATDAMLSMALRVYRDSDGDGTLDAADILMGKIDSMKVSVQGQAPELSYSVSLRDGNLDTVANAGMSNRKRIAVITVSDAGVDTLSGHITGISVANAPANLTFALTPENSMDALTYPLRVANSASVRLNLYAHIDDTSNITDNTEASVTLEIQAADSSNGGVDLHSTAASDAPAISVFYIVVGTQLAGPILNGINERGGTRYFDVQTGAESLRVMLALEDTHGNRDLDLYNEMDHFRFALTGSEADLPAGIYDSDFYEGSSLPLLLVATQSFSIDADGLSSADISVEDMNQAEMFHAVGANIKDVSDGAELRFLVWHSRLSDKVQNFGEQFTLNYIADAAETVGVPTHDPVPISSERSVTIRNARIRAYNTWSGQTDLDASLVSADISQAIMDGLSCAVPLRDSAGFNTSCAAQDVENAVLGDPNNDGVWTFATAPSFRPANTGGGTLQGTSGTLYLAPELSWRINGLPAASFTSSATLLSGAAYRAYQPQTFGLLQTIYTSTEGADPHQTVCVAQVGGMAQPALGDVVATIATQAGDAEEGVDYTAVSSSLNFNRGTIENCWNIPITDDDIPENDETFTVNVSLAWANPESSEAPLIINPAQARVTIISDDKIRVRVEAGRLDDGGDFVAASTPVVTEERFGGTGPDDPLLLRFSFWTDSSRSMSFTDNLGGERRITLNMEASADSAESYDSACTDRSLLSAITTDDYCIGGDDPDRITVQSSASSGFETTLVAYYTRANRAEVYVEILARRDGEIEGEETLTLDPTTLSFLNEDGDMDANYIPDPRNTTLTVRVTDGEAPEVRYFNAGGERVSEITAFEESTSSYRVGIYDKNTDEALALKEAFSFGLGVIGDPLGVVRWGAAGAGVAVDASAITFTFAAGAAADLTFSIFAFDDTGSVSEQGGLQYSYGGGAMNIEHPASLALTVVDNDDGVSPSACVGAIDSVNDLPADENARDTAQANCLRVAATGALGFTLEWDEARDRQDVATTALAALANNDRYRVYLLEQASGTCPTPPTRPTLRQTAAGLSGGAVQVSDVYPAGYELAVDTIALSADITEAMTEAGATVAIKADTRYCAILRVSDSAWVDWAPQPVEVRTVGAEVRYFDAATGQRVSALSVPEDAAPVTFYAGIYNENTGEALALVEEFSFGWTIVGQATSVITITASGGTLLGSSAHELIFTFPVGVSVATFSLQAANDADSVSERGELNYRHISGEINIQHPANFAVIVADDDDSVSPNACAGAATSVAQLPAEAGRADAQAGCLRVVEAGAYGFRLAWDAARDRQFPADDALMELRNANPYSIYYRERGATVCDTPTRPAYDAARPAGAAGYTGVFTVTGRETETRLSAPAIRANTEYCLLLEVTDGAWADWAPAIEASTVAYSPADADDNGVPDHLQLGVDYADLNAYLSAQCSASSLIDYDCDNDDVPDVLELRFGRAADVSISPMALNCRANGLRTRLAADLPSLTCSGATTALDAISDQTLVHAADNQVPAAEPGGVAVSIADPDMLGEEMFLPGRYWLSGDTADSVVNLGLERAVEISAPEVVQQNVDLIVRGRGLGAKLTPSLQQITARLSHSTPVETIQASGFLHISDPPQIGAVVTGATNFSASQLSSLFSRPEVTELLLRMTWTDEVGDGVLQQRILISRPGTTPTLFVPSSEAGMLSIAGGGTFLDDGVLTLAEESSGQTLAVSVDSRPPVSADRWTLTVAGADPTMAPLYFTDSTDTRRAGLTLDQASLDLPLAFLLSLDLALPARLLISWSGEESGADHGAHAVVLIFAPGSTPTAAAKTALLDGYRLGGHYRDGETPREVRPGPGAKIRLGDYAAQRCLQEPDVCSGREELPDRGLGLSAAGDARHPACPRLGAAALPCLDFQLFCDASADECMSGGAVDVVFPLNAPLRADHWLYYSQPRALDGAGRTCPFVQTGMPAHVRPVAGCPGTDQTPAFRSEPIYPDRIYAAPDSIASACPPIGDTSWRSLAEMQDSGADLSTVNCLRVAYSDGGPNDSAPNEAALIADPMGVGAPGASADGFDPLAGNFGSGGGGGALGVLALLALLALTLLSLISTGERSGRRPNPAFLAILLALTLGAAAQARAADWKVFDDAADFFGEVFSGDFFAEGAWATGLDLALSGFDRDISGVQEDADDNDYGFRLRGHWDQDGVWGEGLAAELWWADLGSAALRPDGGGEEVDFDYEAYGLGLTWGWALPRFDWLSIGGFDLNPNHVFAGGGWRDIDVADADGDGAYFTTGLSWNVGEWFNAPAEQWSLRVSYDVFDSEGVDYFAIGLTHRFGAAPTRALPTARPTDARKRLSRRARRGAVPSCGEWDSCACQRPINANARGWYVQVATYSDNGLAVARKRMRQLREAGYREVGLRDNGRGLHALRVSVRGDCREAEALKGRLDALLNVDSMLRGWKDRPY